MTDALPTEQPLLIKRYASIDGPYRYWLERDWWTQNTERGPTDMLAFVMLNPSTADDQIDDPTIRSSPAPRHSWLS